METILTLFCFIGTIIYNKKYKPCKRFFKSLFQVLYMMAGSLLLAAICYTSAYDLQDLYPNFPIRVIMQFLGAVSMYGIPLFYLISIAILIRIDKNE